MDTTNLDTTNRPSPSSLSLAQRGRVRAKLRRHIASIEEEEETSGELNLVPYLDILINTLIFLLASTALAVPMAHVKISARGEGDDKTTVEPTGDMSLTVAIGRDGYYFAGAGGVAGDGQGPTLPCAGGACQLKQNKSGYDFSGLTRLARQLKHKHPKQRKVIITADREVPYRVVVATLDALRGTPREPLLDQVSFSAGLK